MADTVITTPSSSADSSSSAAWAVAVIAIVVLLVGAFVWYTRMAPATNTNTQQPGVNVDVKLPGGNNSNGGTQGGTGGTGGTQQY